MPGKKLPFHNPRITIKDLIRLPFLRNSEEELLSILGNYFGSNNILLLKSARQGIKFALETLNLTPGDEVILPSFICEVVPESVKRAGGKPVFCEVEKEGFNMDFEAAKALVSLRTRAVILSHTFGIPAPVDKFLDLCRGKNILLIEDCVHALGAKFQGNLLGTFGDFAVFSFGISKNIGGVGGGFIYCKDEENFKKIKAISQKSSKSYFPWKKYLEFYSVPLVFNKYFYFLFSDFIERYGEKRRNRDNEREFGSVISNLEIKVALQKLKRYERDARERNENALIYEELLKDIFSFPRISWGDFPSYIYFPVLDSRKAFHILKLKNIPVRRLDSWEFGQTKKEYFLLPLNYSPGAIKTISGQIKKILC